MTSGSLAHEALLARRALKQLNAGVEIHPDRSGGTTAGYVVAPSPLNQGGTQTLLSGGHHSRIMTASGQSGTYLVLNAGGGASTLNAGVTAGALIDAAVSAGTHFYTAQSGNTQIGLGALRISNVAIVGRGSIGDAIVSHVAGSHAMAGVVRTASGRGLYDFIGGSEDTSGQGSWLEPAKTELAELLDGVEADVRQHLKIPSEIFLNACAAHAVEAPAIDLDHDLNVEFFWRTGDEGLLVVIRQDGSIHFFGSSKGESWRSNYLLSGNVWRVHLPVYFSSLGKNA